MFVAKACGASFLTGLALAGLAVGSATLGKDVDPQAKHLLTWTFVLGCIIALIIAAMMALIFVTIWVHRFFHSVEISAQQLYPFYWAHDDPNQDIAHVSGFRVDAGDWAGRVKVTCHASLGGREIKWEEFFRAGSGGFSDIPQKHIGAGSQPAIGDPVIVVLRAEPPWYRGRPCERILRATLQVNDYRTNRHSQAPELTRAGQQGV